jgi:hypothetical protein
MPKRPGKPVRDVNQLAYATMLAATSELPPESAPLEEPKKNPAAVALGKLGGAKGGKARAKSLSKKRRSEIAKKAAKARWRRQ